MKVRFVVSAKESANLPNSRIQEHVGQIISGEILGFIPRDNLLIISKKAIANELKKSHELIRNVSVERKFPNTIIINIEERESHIVWCNRESCVLLDERGEVFYEDENIEREERVRVFDASNKPFQLGDRVADPEFVFFAEKLPEEFLRELSVKIDPVLRTPSSMSGEIRVKTKEGWDVLFSTNRPMGIQMKVMKKIIKEKVSPERLSELEYIDLRIKGKATYKLRQEGLDQEKKGDDDQKNKKETE